MTNVNNTNANTRIADALAQLHTTYTEWMRLQQLTENKLYKLMNGCLQLCYLAKSTDAHMSAFKKQCAFKWGRNTKLTVMVAKRVFGEDNKQAHSYAKALEIAIEEKVGTEGEIDMITWLRSNGGISGVVRGTGSKVSKRKNIIELEREHTIRVGRDAEKYGKGAKYKFDVSEKFMEALRTDDVLLLCRVDRKSKQLAVYAIDENSDATDKYYEQLGESVIESEAYTKYKYKLYEEHKLAEHVASIDISDGVQNVLNEMQDCEQFEIAA